MKYYDVVKEICTKLDFPKEATSCFLGVEKRFEKYPLSASAFQKQVDTFCNSDYAAIGALLPAIRLIALGMKENPLTLNFVFLMHCAPVTRKRYREEGLSDELFWKGLEDIKWKLLECMACKNVPGTFVPWWFDGFFHLKRFTIGRFQFEPTGFYNGEPVRLKSGYVIKKGTRFLGMHIPSAGEPLTDDVRNEAYRLADEFFKDWFNGEPTLIRCGSWLLYERQREFLPAHSNILRFMDDFEIDHSAESKTFHDAWRIYGAYAELPPEEWQEDTSLRRAYKQWVLAGNKTGHGEGWIILDKGNNVTHIDGYFGK